MNVNELILDKVRSLIFTDLEDGSVLGRLTMLEDPSLKTAAEAEEITDAQGALIAKLFRAKTGRFEATNSLFSLDLLAQQYGTEKESLTANDVVYAEEVLTATDGKITLSHTPTATGIKYIYLLTNGALAEKIAIGTMATASEASIANGVISLPTGVDYTKEGQQYYVEYEYAATANGGVRVVNNTENFPKTVGVKIFAIFRDKCNENTKYAGTIVAKKGKIDPTSIDLALTSTGKHSFAIDFMKDYCDESSDLFSVIVAS